MTRTFISTVVRDGVCIVLRSRSIYIYMKYDFFMDLFFLLLRRVHLRSRGGLFFSFWAQTRHRARRYLSHFRHIPLLKSSVSIESDSFVSICVDEVDPVLDDGESVLRDDRLRVELHALNLGILLVFHRHDRLVLRPRRYLPPRARLDSISDGDTCLFMFITLKT